MSLVDEGTYLRQVPSQVDPFWHVLLEDECPELAIVYVLAPVFVNEKVGMEDRHDPEKLTSATVHIYMCQTTQAAQAISQQLLEGICLVHVHVQACMPLLHVHALPVTLWSVQQLSLDSLDRCFHQITHPLGRGLKDLFVPSGRRPQVERPASHCERWAGHGILHDVPGTRLFLWHVVQLVQDL